MKSWESWFYPLLLVIEKLLLVFLIPPAVFFHFSLAGFLLSNSL
jgi:hypothetical protein